MKSKNNNKTNGFVVRSTKSIITNVSIYSTSLAITGYGIFLGQNIIASVVIGIIFILFCKVFPLAIKRFFTNKEIAKLRREIEAEKKIQKEIRIKKIIEKQAALITPFEVPHEPDDEALNEGSYVVPNEVPHETK
ncbi:hypothetical protein RX880_07855 [Pseudomonas syringae pv. actinidiae]|nr:hypothetical protein [Pseudomonas syringae pv. actinidiae]MDU8099232.1 hypothetical protein [Pseudomonas syringae pv. actinidiae]MDU8115756.1 hypothetical protein [Pseudomonas syringae pv. actinidiae]MDU8131852.1 hypothetical protein [Pseudomonas syringae pv. actinidiae]MDU8153118.1 hypothetical protein [Pseudomonas syringae pv. actinidiae]